MVLVQNGEGADPGMMTGAGGVGYFVGLVCVARTQVQVMRE